MIITCMSLADAHQRCHCRQREHPVLLTVQSCCYCYVLLLLHAARQRYLPLLLLLLLT
jgi:hypothetical protein